MKNLDFNPQTFHLSQTDSKISPATLETSEMSSPSTLRRKLRRILDENNSNEACRRAGLHSIANILEENERLQTENARWKGQCKLFQDKDIENRKEIEALRVLSGPNEWMEKRLDLYRKKFRSVLQMKSELHEVNRKMHVRVMFQHWRSATQLANAKKVTGQEDAVEKLEKEIERLEEENAELRVDFVTTEKALKRLRLEHDTLLQSRLDIDTDSDE